MSFVRSLFLSVTLLAMGCGGGGSRPPIKTDGGADMSGGGTVDMASAPDFSMGGTVDMAMGGGKTGCSGFVQCFNMCRDQQCAMSCYDNTTPQGQNLADAVFACIEKACPSQMQGDVCFANPPTMACQNCVNQSQMQGGQCHNQIMACINDKP